LVIDHLSIQSTLTCNVDLPNRTKTPAGLWKLNTSVLLEEGYQKYVNNFIHKSTKYPVREIKIANTWKCILRPGIKHVSVDYSRQRARIIREISFFTSVAFRR
jgi:hypothetical protein